MSGSVSEVTPRALERLLGGDDPPLLVDVRNDWEHAICAIAGSLLIPMGMLVTRLAELPQERVLALYCHHGVRSLMAAQFLAQQGYQALSLAGGVAAWAREIEPGMAQY